MGTLGHITITDALIEISLALNKGYGLPSFLGVIKDVATRLIDSERASIFLLDHSGCELWSLMADGTDVIRMPAGEGIVGEVIAANTALVIQDTASDPRFFPEIDKRTGYVTRSILCVPMRNRAGIAVGAIELLNKRCGGFTTDDERFLGIFGTHAGLAIENVEMHEEIQENLAQFKLLFDIQESINISMEFGQIFEVVLSRLLPVVGGESAIICFTSVAGREVYYGFCQKELQFWEKGGRRECPTLLDELIDAVGAIRERKSSNDHFVYLPDCVYADLTKGSACIGWFAVHLAHQDSRLFNTRPLEYLKVIAAQTVAFIEKKETLDQKKHSEKQALLGSMLSTVVHDMKSPLSGISGYTQLIGMRAKDDEIRKYCDVIIEVLGRINSMNNELLAFVRGEQVVLEKAPVSVGRVVEKVIDMHRESYKSSGIAVTVRCLQEVRIVADADRLIRVFNNILVNAAEAIGTGGAIEVDIMSSNGNAEIHIKDSGRGIPTHMIQRIFEPFVTWGKKNGTGLGLAISRSIVEKHHGTISVESCEGRGTAFTITLPVVSEEES
jgi:signal transduction histidine kinase